MSNASSGANPDFRVSVVVPCYNAQASIRRAIASVASQSTGASEIVAVDDASTDATIEVLQELQAQHPPGWLKIIRLAANRGPGSTRNAGWEAASADWIAFLDADDTWHPRKLEIQRRVLQDHPDADLLAHGHDFSSRQSRIHEGCQATVSTITLPRLLFSNRFVTPSVLLRRSLPERFREGQRYMEDHLLWMEMAQGGRRLLWIDLPLVTLHKAAFGASGQSANLVAMEVAELGNYRLLWQRKAIHLGSFLALCLWSLAKFARRLAIVGLRGFING